MKKIGAIHCFHYKSLFQGDSGGPLVCRKNPEDRFLAGIVTKGPKYCATEVPGVYLDIAKYRDWIDERLGKAHEYYLPQSDIEKISSLLGISEENLKKRELYLTKTNKVGFVESGSGFLKIED